MHIQVVNFHLKGLSVGDFGKLCDELAPTFAGLPGLVAKMWLANPGANTFGGVYLWQDRKAMEDFTKTDLFRSVVTHPNLAELVSRDFELMEGPTRVTRGLIEVGV
jgi:Putative mono-oxygenase ydhR